MTGTSMKNSFTRIHKSTIILEAFLPLTKEEEEAFDFENPSMEIVILGRKYGLMGMERNSNGTFKVSLMPLIEVKFPGK